MFISFTIASPKGAFAGSVIEPHSAPVAATATTASGAPGDSTIPRCAPPVFVAVPTGSCSGLAHRIAQSSIASRGTIYSSTRGECGPAAASVAAALLQGCP